MKLTPAMRQYMDFKEKHPDALLLFRMGDFYETFFEDAKTVSQVLGITLTSRGKDETKAPLAGIPYHALDKYLGQLIQAGHTVALCEQVEDPKLAKGIVKRDVTRIITPGTIVEQQYLDAKVANYLCSVFGDADNCGYACIDVSTGSCSVGECKSAQLDHVIARMQPAEILYNENMSDVLNHYKGQSIALKQLTIAEFSLTAAQTKIHKQFSQHSIIDKHELAQCAMGALLRYVEKLHYAMHQIRTLTFHNDSSSLILDEPAINHLEILAATNSTHSLLKTLDTTKTAMGGRLLRTWLVHPLYDLHKIRARHGAVHSLLHNQLFEHIEEQLQDIADIERICTKINNDLVNPKELKMLGQSLSQVIALSKEVPADVAPLLADLFAMPNVGAPLSLIDNTLNDDPSVTVREGNFIAEGFNDELDELRKLAKGSRAILAEIQTREQKETGITSLKIRYTRVFGYFIEVTSRFADKVPAHYQRKQTLANAERYVTDELKELEHKLLTAQDRAHALEFDLYQKLVASMKEHINVCMQAAQQVAQIDVLSCFAKNTYDYRYCIPEMTGEKVLHIKGARHPVVERHVDSFIPNDCVTDEQSYVHIITGPNMAGKSTYMRQVALCVLLAHCGCGIPATNAKIGLTDRIFTRIGARDDLAGGQSTFMVEMHETASVLHHATEKSLVILDEVGRGTSTFDGVALAYAIAEDLAERVQCRTLFATHYHVLTSLDRHKGVENYNISVAQKDDDIVFLHKVVKGGTDKSYGIHVAKLAGLPSHVIDNALKMQQRLMTEDTMVDRIAIMKTTLRKSDISTMRGQKQLTLDGDFQ